MGFGSDLGLKGQGQPFKKPTFSFGCIWTKQGNKFPPKSTIQEQNKKQRPKYSFLDNMGSTAAILLL